MRALVWHDPKDIRCDEVPDPRIEHRRDAIVKVTSCAICGSDLHLYDGYIPSMEDGDIMGHEFMGEVIEVGADAEHSLTVGERIVVPFTMFCGECEQCLAGNYPVCERSNRNADMAAKVYGHTTAGLFGYSHLTGGYPGGQAQYVRVPFADKTRIKVPKNNMATSNSYSWAISCRLDGRPSCSASSSLPTRSQYGARVRFGQMTIRSAVLLGAKRVICIDRVPERLLMAKAGGATTINFEQENVIDRIRDLTLGKGPEKCIDAVGMEAHGATTLDSLYDRVKQTVMRESDRAHVLREMAYRCRAAGTLSVPGVYGGLIDKYPFGMIMQKGAVSQDRTDARQSLDRGPAAPHRRRPDRSLVCHYPSGAARR